MSAVAARRSAKSSRFRPWLEALEGRITPSMVEVTANPALSVRLGTTLLTGKASTAFAPVPSGSATADEGWIGYAASRVIYQAGGTAQAQAYLSAQHTVDPVSHADALNLVMTLNANPGPAASGSAENSYDAGTGPDPSDAITVRIIPTTGEKFGDPVQLMLNASAFTVLAPSATAGPFHIAYHADYDAGAGPKTFLDGTVDGYKGINQSGNAAPLNLKIGDTVKLRLRAQGDGTGTAPGLTVSCSISTHKPPDLVARALAWDRAQGGLDFKYDVADSSLPAGTKVSVCLAKDWPANADLSGGNFKQYVVGAPLASYNVSGAMTTSKPHAIHIGADKLVNVPFKLNKKPGSNLLTATRIVAVVDPAGATFESREGNNVSLVQLPQVRFGDDFRYSFQASAPLKPRSLSASLFLKVAQLGSYLVGHGLVTRDITLDAGVTDPALAHRASTAWMIANHPSDLLLARLQALKGGKDLDGNRWYDPAWEQQAVAQLKKVHARAYNALGQLTASAKARLWKLIQANAKTLDTRLDPSLEAADGYAKNDAHRLPNTYAGGLDPHVLGLAIDATIAWTRGMKTEHGILGNGGTSDAVANALLADFGLARPMAAEKQHLELM